ncbi:MULTISPECIES: GH3 family domain-containing protein [Geobacter]|uniref:GH3 family domain-containing protein n=1 Tax=Geobacter TaxID=28231 RepID=UPI002572886A|nr:GH3 auxin-responsive promoter family protein [Geobacter sulfurreducens]BEH10913.1 GH3 auxin-responsive promoter family protein [Geobacter sulfurreducens subsp. ethanolicus]BET58757.1 GH3 auxin-responsive promoter family protein [Geobacter sp. 60473]
MIRSSIDLMLKTGAAALAKNFENRDPIAGQREILARLVVAAAVTRFGRDHGFAELAGEPFDRLYAEFRRRVPIRTYADFWRDYFSAWQSDANGSQRLLLEDVTWPGRIPFFCETSGTTAPTKYIPFSREMFAANKRAAIDLTACYLHRIPRSRLFQGKLLYMAGNTSLTDLGNGVQSGDMSGITLRHRPFYLRPFVAPGMAVSALPWEEKVVELAGLLLSDRSIRGISGVPPWIILLLQRVEEMGHRPIAELLPNLELIIHGGTSMKPYRREFDGLFPRRRPHFLEVLPSSEAFMAFQLPGEDRMRLVPHYGAFFEFIPIEDLDEGGTPAADAPTVPLEAVETGRRYAVILTTCAGLWRYHIGDTLRFTALSPHFIEFTGRDRFLDRFEEKVTQGEVEEAVARLNQLDGIEVREFMVGPDIGERRHLWVLAVGEMNERSGDVLGRHLDATLRSLNADYATFRSQGRIAGPRVVTVSWDVIYRWSKEVRGKLGGQSKIPHVDPTAEGEMVASLAAFADGFRPAGSPTASRDSAPRAG